MEYDYNKKKKRSFFRGLRYRTPNEILEQERFKYEDEDSGEPEDESADGMGVDYVRKAPAVRSYYAVLCSVISFIFTVVDGVLLYRYGNTPPAFATVAAACALMWAAGAVIYSILSFSEDDRSYTLSFVSIGYASLLIITWTIVMILGGK